MISFSHMVSYRLDQIHQQTTTQMSASSTSYQCCGLKDENCISQPSVLDSATSVQSFCLSQFFKTAAFQNRFAVRNGKKQFLTSYWLENKGPLKVLNDTKLTLDDHGNNLDSFRISLEPFRSFRGPLLYKPITGQELFFAVSYSKPALPI